MSEQLECVICNKLFDPSGDETLCPECRKVDNNVFVVIRDYIYAHPGASVNEVTQATGVSVTVILRYLREGRLETNGKIRLINCEECGVAIDYGRLCKKCEMAKTHELTSASKVPKDKKSHGMYTRQKK